MNPVDRGHDLERLFDALRRAEEGSIPGFQEVLSRVPRRRVGTLRLRRIVLAAAVTAAVSVAVFLVRRLPALREARGSLSVAQWTAPTDVLLQTPGSELLDRLPELSTPVPSYSLSPPDASNREATPRPTRRALIRE